MKKFIIMTLTVLLSFGNLCYAAEDETFLSVERDGQTVSIEAAGNSAYAYASVKVTDCNGNTDFFDIVKTDSEGKVSLSYYCEADSGTCTAYVNIGDEVMLETEFEFLNSKDLEILADDLNKAVTSGDDDTIKSIILNNADGLSINMEMYNGLSNKDYVFEAIAASKKQVTDASEIAGLFYDAVINASIKSGMTAETLKNVLEDEDFSDILELEKIMPKYGSGNSVYDELTEEHKIKVCEKALENDIDSVNTLKEKITLETLKVGLKEFINAKNVENLLRAYNSDGKINVSFAKYDTLTDGLSAIKSIMGKDYASYAAVETAFAAAISSNSAGGGSGSGSSGGGSGSSGGATVSSGSSGFSGTFVPQTTNNVSIFDDMEDAKWAQPAVNKLYEMKVISGVGEKMFEPNRNIARNEAAKLIAWFFEERTIGTDNPFADVSETHWSYPYVLAVYKNGIIKGKTENIFAGEDNVTREELAVMIYRALNALRKSEIEVKVTNKPKDSENYSEWSSEAILNLYRYGIVKGDQNAEFNPKNDVTRAEAAQMIFNLAEALGITGVK